MQVKCVYSASSYHFDIISYQILIALFKSKTHQCFLSFSQPIIEIYLPEIWEQFSSLWCFWKFFDQQTFQTKLKDKCLSYMQYLYQNHKQNVNRQSSQEARVQSEQAASLNLQQPIEYMCRILTKSILDTDNYQIIDILLLAKQLIYKDYLCLSLLHSAQLWIKQPKQIKYLHQSLQTLIEFRFFQKAKQIIYARESHSDCQAPQQLSKLKLLLYFVYMHTGRDQPNFNAKKINILRHSLKLNPLNQKANELLIEQAVENNIGYVRYYIEQYMAATGNQTYFLPVLAYISLYFNKLQKMKQNLDQMKSLIDNGSATIDSFFRYCQFKNKINLKLNIFQINISKKWPVHQQRSYTYRCIKQQGFIYYKHQQYDRAQMHFYCCRVLLPEHQDYIDILIALCLLSQERYQQAEILIKRFDSADFDLNTKSIGVLLMLGGIYSRLNLIERLRAVFDALKKKQQLLTVQNAIQLNLLKLLNANKITVDQQIVYNQAFEYLSWIPPHKNGLSTIYRIYHQADFFIQYSFTNHRFSQGRKLLHSMNQIIAMTAIVSQEWPSELREKLTERIHKKIELVIW